MLTNQIGQRNFCIVINLDRNDMNTHILGTHIGFPIECDQCCARFRNKSFLDEHETIFHRTSLIDTSCNLKCKLCNFMCSFNDLSSLLEHTRVNHSDSMLECSICNVKCPTANIYEYHINWYHSPGEFLCRFCNETFETRYNLRRHVSEVFFCTADACYEIAEDQFFPCFICRKSFSCVSAFEQHFICEHKQFKHCSFKGEGLQRECDIAYEDFNPLCCTQCPFSCGEARELENHLEMCLDLNTFHCNICDLKCGNETTLLNHLFVMHSQDKPVEDPNMKSLAVLSCNSCYYKTTSPMIQKHHMKYSNHSNFATSFHNYISSGTINKCFHVGCRFKATSIEDLRNHVRDGHIQGSTNRDSEFKENLDNDTMSSVDHNMEPKLQNLLLCHLCQINVVNKQLLNDHMLECHHYPCTQCKSVLFTESELRKHVNEVHQLKLKFLIVFPCQLCPVKVDNKQLLNDHMLECHRHPCTHCKSVSVSESELEEHVKEVHKLKLTFHSVFTCQLCPVRVNNEQLLNDHMLECHHYPCTAHTCKSVFTFESALKEHVIEFHTKRQLRNVFRCLKFHIVFPCQLCPVKFDNKQLLNDHMLECHHHPCTQCKSVSVSESELEEHVKEVHKLKLTFHSVFTCQLCPVRVNNEQLLNDHMLECHHYPCTAHTCKSVFTFESALKEHVIEFHTKRQRNVFRCLFCLITFFNKQLLDFHMQKCHNRHDQCCGSQFVSRSALIDHMKENHPFICSDCGSKFAFQNELKEHSISAHKMVKCSRPDHIRKTHLFLCSYRDCTSKFKNEMKLMEHTSRVHKIHTFRVHRNLIVPVDKMAECSFCKCKFETETELKEHTLRSHCDSTFITEKTDELVLLNELHVQQPSIVKVNTLMFSDNECDPNAEVKLEDQDYEIERHRMLLSKICRLCGSKTDDEYKASDYFAEILILTESDTFKDTRDVHPQNLCEICKDKLQETELFCAAEFKPHSDCCSICQ